jgi:hypothetical protein
MLMLFEEIYGTTGMKKAARRLHHGIIKRQLNGQLSKNLSSSVYD